ncbi:amidase [Atopobacter sp. AH10]|uniref:amidase n=1 Tax=Atopobacter sp. AH10 TaxID=2315861 RepID=UPI000EF1FB2B|nr:amidase [Atopobacter sp. AH10]RLK63098.1 amidase [Atopobacter sp. AH10]
MLFHHDASDVADLILKGELSVTEAVTTALCNIHQFNGRLNAVSHLQEREALKKAKAYDHYLSQLKDKQDLAPFFGVPLLLKDLGQEEAGQPSSCGAQLMKNYIAKRDSNFVKQIKKSGFIIVGRSNVPEFGFKNTSDAIWTGSVSHPLNPNLTPGGSSGGAAAALKAGLVPAVTASDGGGSIRIPASFTGLIGLKPTRGRTPVGPDSYRSWQGASIDFALHRSVRDCWKMLKSLQIAQKEAAFYCPKIEEKDLLALNRPLKIAFSYQVPAGFSMNSEVRLAFNHALHIFESLGHQLVEVPLPLDGKKAMETYYMVNAVESQVMFEGLSQMINRPIDSSDLEAMSFAIGQVGKVITGADYSKILAYWDQMAAHMENFFKDYDIFLSPTTNGPAFEQGKFSPKQDMIEQLQRISSFPKKKQLQLIWDMFEDSFEWTPFTQQQNLLGQPAISLPMVKTSNKLPLGIQAWSARGQDYLLLQLALQLEPEFPDS